MEPAVAYVESGALPRGLDNRGLRRRALQIVVVLVVLGLVAAFAPGLGEVRERIERRSRADSGCGAAQVK